MPPTLTFPPEVQARNLSPADLPSPLPRLTSRFPLGLPCSDPTGRYSGWVVAVFQNYPAAFKWASWDTEYLPPTGRRPHQRFLLVATPKDGALLIGVRDARRPVGIGSREKAAGSGDRGKD